MWDSTVREVLNGSFDAVFAVDRTGRIIDHNQSAARIFGSGADGLNGQLLAPIALEEEERDRFIALIEQITNGPQTATDRMTVQLRIRTGSGSGSLTDVSLSPMTYSGRAGEHPESGANVFVRDPTERLQAENRLAQMEERARLFQQAVSLTLGAESYDSAMPQSLKVLSELTGWPVGHVLTPNHDGSRLVSAQAWYFAPDISPEPYHQAFGPMALQRGEELPGQVWESLQPLWIEDVSTETHLARFADFHSLGIRGVIAFPVISGDQLLAVLEFYSPRPMTPTPQLLEMVTSIGSQLARIMERCRAQEEQARQAAIVAASSDAIIGKSLDGTIITWNHGAERVYGYTATEIIGRPITVLAPDSEHEEEVILDVASLGRRLENFETTRRRRDGSLIPVSISASPIFSPTGEIVGTASIERDISHRKERERELEQARESAETADRTKSQFLANVSHELRTPMNAIIGMIDLSFHEQLTPRLRDYMETVRDSSRTLLDLINDVLDFSRLDVGGFQLMNEPFNLRDVMERTIRTLAIRADEKGLELACRIHPDVPECLQGDGRRLRQIVMNLVGNAIKFTDRGEVVVDVQLADSTDANTGVTLQFAVRDTGSGIPEEFHETIFEPFTQVDASSTRAHSGTGLGLAICRELVHRMGGRISLQSAPGSGSCFCFSAQFAPATVEQIARLERFEPTGDLIGLRVLVVDDNATNREILNDLLTRWKMHPTLAATGEAALAHLREASRTDHRFPLILLDALMPHMDGFMLLQTAAEEGLLEGATILMLSSAERIAFDRKCEEAPVAAFLEKPVSQSDLFDSMITALHGTGMRTELPGSMPSAHQPLRLLVAEDTPANQKVVRLMLEHRGHDVTIVENGRDAIDAVQQNHFDAVLMDVQMPVMDGLTATAQIRQLEDADRAATPIVALTAHAIAGDQERCLAAGMNAYVAKPIELFELIRTVEEAAGIPVGRLTATRTLQTLPALSAEPPHDIFSYTVALSRLNGNVHLFRDMVAFFSEDAPRLVREIENSLEQGAAPQIRRAAHSLKGLCANFEAQQARDVALRMEEAGRADDLAMASDLLPVLKAAVMQLETALTAHIDLQEKSGGLPHE